MHPRHRAATTIALATIASLPLTWSTLPSYADAASGAGDDAGTSTVSVQLAAPDPGRLAAVAGRRIVDHADRLAKLADLVPDAEQRADVVADLQARGFTVDSQSTWSVTASAPDGLVADTFGSALPADSALPDVPASLSDDVAAALPTDGPPVLHPLGSGALDGADVRDADSAAGLTASTGGNDSALTVATLQFSSWTPSDLSTYAGSSGLADPIATGQYRAVDLGLRPQDNTGADEVALDQEALLSVAPSARQMAYFAPNTSTGFADALARVATDAAAPDAHIAALSISWGGCEAAWGKTTINLIQTRLNAVVAAGVTVFAASGDAGIYDCRGAYGTSTTQPDVDFPGSSPSVVSVGATNLSSATGGPNTGSSWTETAWSCSSSSECLSNGGGSGGGVSGSAYGHGTTRAPGDFTGFDKPSWQQSAVTSSPFAATTKRMVPDIAADGDPATGLLIYRGGWYRYGGTSLAAPLSAGQLVNLLGDAGATTGLGDIHAALYQAYSATRGLAANDPAKVFRDVTSGSNGAGADAGADPSVGAAAGYDTVSGLGGVLWHALAPYLNLRVAVTPASSATPGGTTLASAGSGGSGAVSRITASARLKLHGGGPGGKSPSSVLARWRTTVTGGTLASASVRITSRGKFVYAGSAGSGSTRVKAKPGQVYVLIVSSRDSAGNVVRRTVRLRTPR